MWWWVSATAIAVVLIMTYLAWLAGRVRRLHARAETATAALDATLVRRAAAAAVLAEQLAGRAPQVSTDLYAAARAALDATPAEREGAENDLTQKLRRLPEVLSAPPTTSPAWLDVVTASRRVGLARQVHTDVVRDALALRRRIPVRIFRLTGRHTEPAYFDVDDPGLDAYLENLSTQATER